MGRDFPTHYSYPKTQLKLQIPIYRVVRWLLCTKHLSLRASGHTGVAISAPSLRELASVSETEGVFFV